MSEVQRMHDLPDFVTLASNFVFLAFLVGIPVYGFFKGVKVYEVFVTGAQRGV